MSTKHALGFMGLVFGTAVALGALNARTTQASTCSYSKDYASGTCVCVSGSSYTSCSAGNSEQCVDCSVGDFCCC
jgi:hypothetical protein